MTKPEGSDPMKTKIVSRHYLLEGRVQGVGFRYFVYRVAQEAGVKGWVRNLFDGRVEVRAEGASDAMRDFSRKLEMGPPMSSVRRITVDEVDSEGFDTFGITG